MDHLGRGVADGLTHIRVYLRFGGI